MVKKIKLARVDAAFKVAAMTKGENVTFRITINNTGQDLTDKLNRSPYVLAIRRDGQATVIDFDHAFCDALGAMQVIRSAVTATELSSLDVIRTRSKVARRQMPSRRRAMRLRGHRVDILTPTVNTDEEYNTCYFVADDLQTIGESLTGCIVKAIHTMALDSGCPPSNYSSVLIAITVKPWSIDRPARNLSSGFVSIVSRREVALGKMKGLVNVQFEVGRQSREVLLRRISRFGIMPSPLSHALGFAGRVVARPSETAVVSNMGTIRDLLFESLGSPWFFVPPIRSRGSLGIGLMKLGNTLSITVSGRTSNDSLVVIATELLKVAGVTAREFRVEE
jgi:hypothetical protein